MDDTRLLKLASKAANENYGPDNNPLEDDALALRLAVKLGMRVSLRQADADGGSIRAFGEEDDPYAATRRAIVRAAAEIGRTL